MSRTDKDMPWWMRSKWFMPMHYRCEYTRFAHRKCDLPTEPVFGPQAGWWYKIRRFCFWEATWPGYGHRCTSSKRERHLGWWGPDRAQVRDLMHDARKQYRGSEDVEILKPEPGNHRHASKKGWWD